MFTRIPPTGRGRRYLGSSKQVGDFLADLDHLFLPTNRIQKYSTGNRYGNGTNVMRFRFAL